MLKTMYTTCRQCGTTFPATGARGRTPIYCSARCRQRAKRARDAQPFPPEMMGKRWTRADGKRPIMVDGSPASSTNPATWAEFRDVQQGAGDGYGIMLGDGLACYDIDHCFNPNTPRMGLTPWGREVLAMIRRARERVLFAEVSRSGNGLHIFVEGEPGLGRRTNKYEYYSRARFIRVTGERVEVIAGV